ncbi:MAG: hypothetical protein Q9166_006522 [cf. Caloplaca sp. 2 TL-2023]
MEEALRIVIEKQDRVSQHMSIVIERQADAYGSSQPSASENNEVMAGDDDGQTINEPLVRNYDIASDQNAQRWLPGLVSSSHSDVSQGTNENSVLKMYYNPLDGPELILRVPRITPWSHAYWSYAIKGDLQAIKNMYATRKASPFDVTLQGMNILCFPAIYKNYQTSQFLIGQGVDPGLSNGTKQPGEILLDCSLAGRYGEDGVSIVRSMLENDDCIESQGFSALHKTVLGIIPRDLRAELEFSTADIDLGDARNRTPLLWAVIRDDLVAVKILLDAGADVNLVDALGNAPLGFARSFEVCKALLSAQANINSRSRSYHSTALHQLCYHHATVEVIDLLVAAGIPVNTPDEGSGTPLNSAVFSHQTAAAKRLIALGADVNAASFSARINSIHFAVCFSHYEILPLLLARGMDYTATDVHLQNIGHMAAISADTRTIKTLAVSRLVGLDLSLKDLKGKTPADYLAEREMFSESEVGIHEAFAAFADSVKPKHD